MNNMFQKLLSKAAMRLMVIKGNGSLRRLEENAKDPMEINRALLMKILRDKQDTAYGKAHHFSEIRSIEDYRKQVPISVYEDFAPMIERTKDGEDNLLTSAKILGYSRTSGSSGVPKYIPATDSSLTAYVRYTWTRALALGAREKKKNGESYRPGRGVFLSPATNECLPNGLPCSNIAEIGAREYGRFYPYILTGKEKYLSIRAFTDAQKLSAYERQLGICPECGKHFELEQMEADHITPWHEGGKTTPENCQMLCRDCNRRKSGK